MNKQQLRVNYPLIINSKSTNYQYVHFDMEKGEAIAFKFSFKSNSLFDITAGKYIIGTKTGPVVLPLKNVDKTKKVNNEGFLYQMDVELPEKKSLTHSLKSFNDLNNAEKEEFKNKFKLLVTDNQYCKTTENEPKKDNIIDIHIINTNKSFDFIKPQVHWGNHFCKFYVV